MNFNIAGRENGHVILVFIFQRSRSIRFFAFAGMDFSAYFDTISGDIQSMVDIDSTMIVIGNIIIISSYCHCIVTFDAYRVQSLGFTNISLQFDFASAGIDFQAGIGKILFLNKSFSPVTLLASVAASHGSIIPLAICTIANSQERTAVIWLCSCNPTCRPSRPDDESVHIGSTVICSFSFRILICCRPIRANIAVELCAFPIISFPFRAGHPVHTIRIQRIIR